MRASDHDCDLYQKLLAMGDELFIEPSPIPQAQGSQPNRDSLQQDVHMLEHITGIIQSMMNLMRSSDQIVADVSQQIRNISDDIWDNIAVKGTKWLLSYDLLERNINVANLGPT